MKINSIQDKSETKGTNCGPGLEEDTNPGPQSNGFPTSSGLETTGRSEFTLAETRLPNNLYNNLNQAFIVPLLTWLAV